MPHHLGKKVNKSSFIDLGIKTMKILKMKNKLNTNNDAKYNG